MCQIKAERNLPGTWNDIYGSEWEGRVRQMLEVSEKWRRNTRQLWRAGRAIGCYLSIFKYSEELRKIMYTTNTIESLNSSYRRINKSRTVFPGDQSLLKSIYLATVKITSKWTMRYKTGFDTGQLQIMFEGVYSIIKGSGKLWFPEPPVIFYTHHLCQIFLL